MQPFESRGKVRMFRYAFRTDGAVDLLVQAIAASLLI